MSTWANLQNLRCATISSHMRRPRASMLLLSALLLQLWHSINLHLTHRLSKEIDELNASIRGSTAPVNLPPHNLAPPPDFAATGAAVAEEAAAIILQSCCIKGELRGFTSCWRAAAERPLLDTRADAMALQLRTARWANTDAILEHGRNKCRVYF